MLLLVRNYNGYFIESGGFCRVLVQIDNHMVTKADLMSFAPEEKVDNLVSHAATWSCLLKKQ